MMKRILSWLIILCLVFSLLPVTAFATGDTNLNAFSIVGINPLYADVITEADLVKPNRSLLYSGNAKDAQYYNAEAAGAQLRKGLVSRNETIVVNACCASSLETYNADAED